ncbi:MAG: hypothetical protein KDI04_07615 [Halieaceae bacterium]|nr:hypothetical protein [Halieaceae bacterium]MCP5194812.1 hypothetical protein [Pseudomonadales bacterium]
MNRPLAFNELEQVYELMARAIDEAGAENEALFLGKLGITLAHRLGDLDAVREAIGIAARGLADH